MKQIHNYSRAWFESYFLSKGLAKFRATQVFEALYSKQVKSFEEISNINNFRNTPINTPKKIKKTYFFF